MTVSYERTRAQQFAGEFLKKIRDMPDAPQVLREEAVAILRHYPSSREIEVQAVLVERAQTPIQCNALETGQHN